MKKKKNYSTCPAAWFSTSLQKVSIFCAKVYVQKLLSIHIKRNSLLNTTPAEKVRFSLHGICCSAPSPVQHVFSLFQESTAICWTEELQLQLGSMLEQGRRQTSSWEATLYKVSAGGAEGNKSRWEAWGMGGNRTQWRMREAWRAQTLLVRYTWVWIVWVGGSNKPTFMRDEASTNNATTRIAQFLTCSSLCCWLRITCSHPAAARQLPGPPAFSQSGPVTGWFASVECSGGAHTKACFSTLPTWKISTLGCLLLIFLSPPLLAQMLYSNGFGVISLWDTHSVLIWISASLQEGPAGAFF